MAMIEATLKLSAKKTGGAQIFSGLGEIAATAATVALAKAALATAIQVQIDNDTANASHKQEVLDSLNV